MNYSDRVGARIPGPTLLRLIQQHRFPEALEQFRARPHDALYKDGVGETALYALCKMRPDSDHILQMMEEIVAMYPNLVDDPNNNGVTPMHAAAMQNEKGRDTQRQLMLLITASPLAVKRQLPRSMSACTPFHFVCQQNASGDVLKAMLEIDPSLATLPKIQISDTLTSGYPLFLLWVGMKGIDAPENWPKMELLLRAAIRAPLDDHPRKNDDSQDDNPQIRFDVLRAACMVNPCPRDFIQMLIQRYPHRLSWRDQHGLLPLHHAILSSDKKWPHHAEFLIEAILKRYPDAAAYPFGDKLSCRIEMSPSLLPIHVLIADSGMTWQSGGIKDLAFAYPNALQTPDPRNQLVPALSSAPLAVQSRLHLSTTYELMRLSPEIFQHCAGNEATAKSAAWPFEETSSQP
jgi:hypothetical protein